MSRIAIIGMACIFPGAADMPQFWQNICQGVDATSDVPEGRWEGDFYDPTSHAVDRFYCRRGGFIDQHADFDPLAFGIMPKIADSVEPDQLLTLKVGYQALEDAGYLDKAFARERTGVIIGRGNYVSAGVLRLEQRVRMVPQIMQSLRDLFPAMGEELLAEARARLERELSYYGPDMASGLIPNLTASRLANRLDLHGPAYTVDAACASALLAVEQAAGLLARGDADMMLVGGVHLSHDLTFWATFCQLGALSRRGVSSPLSSEADGILAGEGIGLVVLKRLDDALAAGDRIYTVIEGVGSASDGRSSSLVAPSKQGQLLALERAWQHVPFSRDEIGLVEAHGTGTPTGDEVELATMAAFFGPQVSDAARPVIGSVKSMIGHTMPAAGMAGLIKTALSVYHGVLPPTLHCQAPHPLLDETRFRVLPHKENWTAARDQRIAALNAFGFGGINAHVVLRGLPEPVPASMETALPPVLMLAATTTANLLAQLDRVIAGETVTEGAQGDCRLVIIEPNDKRLTTARKAVQSGKAWSGRQQIWFSPQGLLRQGGKLAMVFPGVDSTFAPQAMDLAAYFDRPLPPWCRTLDPGQNLLQVVLGLLGFNRMLYEILGELGIKADAFAGHSVGEWSAMLASGMMDQGLSDRTNEGLDFDAMRFPDVQFLAAACDEATLHRAMAGLSPVAISHDNCPHQVIACGQRDVIAEVDARLKADGVFTQVLPIVSGFHSPMFSAHMDWYRTFFAEAELLEPEIPVWSATTAQPFPKDMAAKQQLALDHLLEPVRFRSLIDAMYADGYRIFIQVGTGSLPGFIDDTLSGRPHLAIHTNHEARSGLAQLQMLCAALWVEGMVLDMRLLQPVRNTEMESAPLHPATPASGRRLRLGVPLLRVREPLSVPMPYTPSVDVRQTIPPTPDDMVGQLVHATLQDIARAGDEILAMWQQHKQRLGLALPVAPVTPQISVMLDQRVTRVLDLATTIPLVADHALYPQRPGWPILADCHPVVPLTMEVMLVREAVVEALRAQNCHWQVTAVSQIQAYNWLVVTEPVVAEIVMQSLDAHTVMVEIVGYFKAQVTIAPDWPEAEQTAFAPLQHPRATRVDAKALYDDHWMFHGPAYQGVEQFKAIGDDGVDGILRVPTGSGALLDNMGQLAGYWVMEQPDNCLAMPIGVDRICFHAPDPEVGEKNLAQVRIRQLDGLNCVSDHILFDVGGRVRITIQGWRTRRYQMDQAFWEASRDLSQCTVSRAIPPNVMLFSDTYDTAILRDYISRRYLTASERAVYDGLSPRRRRHWLSGRVAAKDAVRGWLRSHGHRVYPQEMVIRNTEAGVPHVISNVTDQVPINLCLSIAHKDHLAAAIIGDAPVGIDIERIEHRDEAFLSMAFTSAERMLLIQSLEPHDIVFTRAWVAKEVFGKRQGTGIGGHLHQYVIEARMDDLFCIQGHWIVTHHWQDYVLGWSVVLQADAVTAPATPHIKALSI